MTSPPTSYTTSWDTTLTATLSRFGWSFPSASFAYKPRCIDGFSAKLAASEPYCGWLFASRHGSLDHHPDPLRRRFNLPIADMSVAQGHRRV